MLIPHFIKVVNEKIKRKRHILCGKINILKFNYNAAPCFHGAVFINAMLNYSIAIYTQYIV